MRALSTGESEFYAITKGSAHSLHSQSHSEGVRRVVVEAVVLSDEQVLESGSHQGKGVDV